MNYIGVDIGGSHITAATVDLNKGIVVEQSIARAKVNPHASADEILHIWTTAIAQASQNCTAIQLGIAMPGPFDYTTGICSMKNVNKFDALYGINIKEALAERLNLAPQSIIFRNDSEAFLAGEMRFGAGKGFQKGIGITLGTGLGTSIFDNGIAQDMGLGITYQMLEGVAEDYISTRWFVNTYQQKTQKNIEGVKQLVQLYSEDETARQIFGDFAENLGFFICEFIKQFTPEVIVVGGNIAQASEKFFPYIQQQLHQFPHPIHLVRATLNEQAALMGAIDFGLTD